jgi:hypothetical protein
VTLRILAPLLLVAAVAAAALPIDDRRPRAEPAADVPRDEAPRAPAAAREEPAPSAADVPRARCPAGVAGCRSVRGTVLYVERVDPDGDGDLHVVVLGGSVTAPGMTAIDVRADLRPQRDPRPGESVSAAGPVQPGSYGQAQIHALEFRARPR